MTLKSCLEIGTACGLETVFEAIMNIDIHAINIFDYSKITEEINEIIKERDVLYSKTNFANDSRIIDVLKWLNSGQQNVGELTQEQPKTQEQTTEPELPTPESEPDKIRTGRTHTAHYVDSFGFR